MKKLFFVILLLSNLVQVMAQPAARGNSSTKRYIALDSTSINLKGSRSVTIISNHTRDTVKLAGNVYSYLPVSEQSFKLTILPGRTDTVQASLIYPDFLEFSTVPMKLYNAPGKVVHCTLESLNPFRVSFQGDLNQENTYYQAYFASAKSNNVYYRAGEALKDFNHFLQIADSINQINVQLLNSYAGTLSVFFKKQELQRLQYNNAFMKYHVLFDREFKSAHPIPVGINYYDFEKELPLSGKEVRLSTQYLWYAVFNLRRKALLLDKNEESLAANMLKVAAKEYAGNELGDVLKMRFLYDSYPQSKQKFLALDSSTVFVNPDNKLILDSVVNARNGLPKIGKKIPALKFMSIEKDSVSLYDFEGKQVMVNFWATWCGACITEFPYENSLQNKYSGTKGLVVVNICVDSHMEDWKKVSLNHNLQVVNLFADATQYELLKKQFNLYALPRSILIGKDSKVISNSFKRASQVKEADLEN